MILKFVTIIVVLTGTAISVQGLKWRNSGYPGAPFQRYGRSDPDGVPEYSLESIVDDLNIEKRNARSNDEEVITGQDLGFRKAALDTINYFRDDHSAPSLALDAGLNTKAQAWAEHLATGNRNPAPSCTEQACKYGESISIVSTQGEVSDSETSAAVRRVIRAWYAQGRNYDFRRQGLGSEIGNDFTQLIWKASRKIGVGVGRNSAGDRLYVVVQFSPPGNRRGLFARNVLPAYY